MFWSYAWPSGAVAMPCVQRTNWSMSLVRPLFGSRAIRTTMAASAATATSAMRAGVHCHALVGSGVIGESDPLRHPVPLGEAVDPPERTHLATESANGVGHLPGATEQPVELALVQPDARDLPLELIRHVGVLRRERDVARQLAHAAQGQVLEAPEVAPPGVRKVLVERDLARVVGPRHHPATALLEQPNARLRAQPVVDVVADAEGKIDALRLEPGDLAAKDLVRRDVVAARPAEQLVVALVTAEHGVGEVEEDDGRFREVRESLVLDAPPRHELTRGGGLDDRVGVDRTLCRQRVDHRLPGERLRMDARAAVPRRALPEPLRGRVRVLLRRLEPISAGGPWRREARVVVGRPVVGDVGSVEGLRHRPHRLRPESQRLALVRRQLPVRAAAGEDGQDRDVLPQLAQARDEAAAGERDVVGVRRDEDVGHARPSIPTAPCPPSRRESARVARRPHERHEDDGTVRPLAPPVDRPLDDEQILVIAGSDRDDEAGALCELAAKRFRQPRSGRSHDDAVERTVGRVARAPVAQSDVDAVIQTQPRETRAGGVRELRLALVGDDAAPERREDSGLVAGTGPDLEDQVSRLRPEELRHPCDDVRLADRLARRDRDGTVLVRLARPVGHERLARQLRHHAEDSLVGDPPRAQLLGDHRLAGLERAVALVAHGVEDMARRVALVRASRGSGLRPRDGHVAAARHDGEGDAAAPLAAGDSLAAGEPLAAGDSLTAGLALDDGAVLSLATGVGAGFDASSPPCPRSRPLSRISTKIATVTRTKILEIRSSMWTGTSDGVAAAGCGGMRPARRSTERRGGVAATVGGVGRVVVAPRWPGPTGVRSASVASALSLAGSARSGSVSTGSPATAAAAVSSGGAASGPSSPAPSGARRSLSVIRTWVSCRAAGVPSSRGRSVAEVRRRARRARGGPP